jgi:thiol-disulfide isomerase/thioredoxin
MEALIAFMVSSGLAAKRPPHICWPLAEAGGIEEFEDDMSEEQPERDEPVTRGKPKRAQWTLLGALLIGVILYGVYRAVPISQGGKDLADFAAGPMKGLETGKAPVTQPLDSFFGPDGAPIQLSAFHGKVVLVNLWATWCAPCVTEMPTLASLQQGMGNKDFKVVAISVDKADAAETAKKELAELSRGNLAFYHDPKMAIVYPLKARGFPTSILYDREGKELARLAGEADWNSSEARALIQAVIDQ